MISGTGSRKYPAPDPSGGPEESDRFAHRDLPGLGGYDLWRELQRVKSALAGTPRRDEDRCAWLLERLRTIKREQRLRRERRRPRFSDV